MRRRTINWIRPPRDEDEVMRVAKCVRGYEAAPKRARCLAHSGNPISAIVVYRPEIGYAEMCATCWESLVRNGHPYVVAVVHLDTEKP